MAICSIFAIANFYFISVMVNTFFNYQYWLINFAIEFQVVMVVNQSSVGVAANILE